MRIKLKESQYKILESFLMEARQEVKPTSLSPLFDKNPTTQMFSVTQRVKGGSDNEYFFKLEEINGHKMIKDFNKGTNTKGCTTDARFDTIVFGNKLTLPFGSCGTLNLNNIIGVKLYASEEDAKAGKDIDSMAFEHDLDTSNEDLSDRYNDMLRHVKIGQEVYFDSNFKWDGEVTRKAGSALQIDLFKHGMNEGINEADVEWNPGKNTNKDQTKKEPKKKPVRKSITLNVDLEETPFYDENGTIMFKAMSHDAITNEDKEFIIPIKKFSTSETKKDTNTDKQKQSDSSNLEDKSDEELVGMGREAMDMILNNPDLKQAFYKHPSFMNLFIAGLKGKKAPGTGILPTLQLLNQYGMNKMDERFIPTKSLSYIAYGKPISIQTFRGNLDISTDKNNYRRIRVNEYSIGAGNDYTVLEDVTRGYKINVKTPFDEVPDVFICDVYVKTDRDSNFNKQLSNVKLQMLPSNGYRQSRTTKTSRTEPLNDK